MDKQQKWLLRQFHALCGKLGLSEERKREIIASYGVESSKDIDNRDLMDICHTLEKQLNGDVREADRLRKRVIAAIGGWLRLAGQPEGLDRIKGIACRAAQCEDFNKIPNERLRNLYYAFLNKQKDTKAVEGIASEIMAQMCFGGPTNQIPN